MAEQWSETTRGANGDSMSIIAGSSLLVPPAAAQRIHALAHRPSPWLVWRTLRSVHQGACGGDLPRLSR